jgi:ribosomal protein S18 acetylase RimI-like enzyme
MTVDLRPLSPDDFDRRRPRLIAAFADDLVDNSGVTREEATAESARQLDELLPDGADTEGQILRKAVDDDGTEVGFIWIAAAGLSHPGMAWVGVIEVQPEARSRGVGSRMMLAAEDDLRRRGTTRLGLHVFGHNTGAQRLYTRLGYGILNQIWQRPATIATDPRADRAEAEIGTRPASPGVELRPVPADVAAELVDGLVATDPHGVARDPEASIEQARRYVRQVAPDGLDAPDVCIRAAYSGGRRIGWIWFGLAKPQHPAVGVVNHIEVLPEERRRGHGRAMVAAAAAELARRDVPYIGLDVPGTRPAALAFAASAGLGMTLISQQMVKKL